MSITADQVKALRDMTGAPMMDCKRALTETSGDMEAAKEFLRKKGLAVAEKRKGRATKEGLLAVHVEGPVGGMVELNCETDFVARNADFGAFAAALARHVVASQVATVEELLGSPLDGRPVQNHLHDLLAKIGENILISRFTRVVLSGDGVVEPYVHLGGRVGVLVALGAGSAELATRPAFRELAHELALHIAFSNPLCVERGGVPAETVERERRIARERAIEQGKPEKILDKIVQGQLAKFFAENVLLEQPYVKDDKITVQQWIADQAKALGGSATVQSFVRWERGEAMAERE